MPHLVPCPPPPPASAQTQGHELGKNLVENGDFSGTEHSPWSNNEGYTADTEKGTAWGHCATPQNAAEGEPEPVCEPEQNAQDIRIADLVSGDGRYEVTFSFDVKDDGPDGTDIDGWQAFLIFTKAYECPPEVLERMGDTEGEEASQCWETTGDVSFRNYVSSDGWQTYKATFPLPKGSEACSVCLFPHCDKTQCKAVTLFTNVSVVINKVAGSERPNTTSRIMTPKSSPDATYDLGGRRQPEGRRNAVSISGGRLRVVK